jgi:methyl-accepting chemotaxis protein PixJ
VDVRHLLDVVDDLKDELERSGRPDRFVMEKMQQIEEFAHHLEPVITDRGTEAASVVSLHREGFDLARQLRRLNRAEAVLDTAVREVQAVLQCDRVLVCQFDDDRQGSAIAESLSYGWPSLQRDRLAVDLFGVERASDFLDRPIAHWDNPSDATSGQRRLLDRFQLQAAATVPIILQRQVWGVLSVQHCTAPRVWNDAELAFLYQAATEVTLALQALSRRDEGGQRGGGGLPDGAIARVEQGLRSAPNRVALLETATADIRELLGCDRVALYQFGQDWSGDFVAESLGDRGKALVGATAPDPHFQQLKGGRYARGEVLAVPDTQRLDLGGNSPDACHIQLLEQFQIRACVMVPVVGPAGLWGLLMACQHDRPRDWQPEEVRTLAALGTQLGLSVGQHQNSDRDRLHQALDRLSQARDRDALLTTASQELRTWSNSDRVAIYRFGADWSGDFIAEAVAPGQPPLVGHAIADRHFKGMEGGRYSAAGTRETSSAPDSPAVHVVSNVATADLAACLAPMLDKFQIQAYVSAPIWIGETLWGLVMVCQSDRPRPWDAVTVNAIADTASRIGRHLRHHEQHDRDRLLEDLAALRQTRDLATLYTNATQSLRQWLNSDRVAFYRFGPDWSGDFIAESHGSAWPAMVGNSVADSHFQGMEGGRYAQSSGANPSSATPATPATHVVSNIAEDDTLPACLRPIFAKFQAQAYVSVPITHNGQLWGLLMAFQNDAPRAWSRSEVATLTAAGSHLGTLINAHQQRERQQLQRLGERLNESRDFDSIYALTTQEARQVLSADRVALYRFGPDWGGDFVAESHGNAWKPLVGNSSPDRHFQGMKGGRYVQHDSLAVADIYSAGLDPRHVELLERAQAKAYLSVPVFVQDQLWGLAIAYQNSGPRAWSGFETDLLQDVASHLGQALAHRQRAERDRVETSLGSLRNVANLNDLWDTATRELRQLIQVDRAAIYRFNEDWSGSFVAESIYGNWPRLVGNDVPDDYFQGLKGGRYVKRDVFVVNDIYKADLDPRHRELIERTQAKAYVSVPVFVQDKLWGLLIAYNNSSPRYWDSWTVSIATEFGQALGSIVQQVESIDRLQQQVNRQRAVAMIVDKIHQFLDLDTIMQTTTNEMRILMKLDRAAVYRFNPDWSGDFVSESVSEGWRPLLGRTIRDTYFERTKGGRYINGETLVVADVYKEDYDPCHLELLKDFQCRAYIITPVLANDQLWGLLAAYQNSSVRFWEAGEVDLVVQMGTQMGVAVQQAEYLNKLETQANRLQKAADRDLAISSTIDKIRTSLDIATIFRTTTTELRQLLEADRAGIYRFNEDWSGEFISESVGAGWTKLIDDQIRDASLKDSISNCDAFSRFRSGDVQTARVDDTFLQENEGGRYRAWKSSVVNDVSQAGFSPCYLNVLERFQAKAYAIAPIFVGERLWGLLAVYQNTGPRQWDESEVGFVVQVGAQLGIALKQAESVEALQQQSIQLEEAARRDKAAKEDLQQKALRLLMAVRPALEGDLTVRAPITEDEVGTIADAYNNTLQSLREIVQQLQSTAAKVSDTSKLSSRSISELASKAQEQYGALTRALEQVEGMAGANQAVTLNAQQVSEAVQRANATVMTGDSAMNRTVDAILAVRETVAETGRKLRSLRESSQKISKIVSLISNFTTQTQLLALNAAIEATRAGEYGRGFTVVADEVRSLARQSAEATTEIEALVEEIQSETNEVAAAMETGIQQVAEGSNLVTDTRQSLSEIIAVTGQIGQLVEGITATVRQQTEQSQSVTQTMVNVAAIADRTSEDSTALAASFEELLGIAEELQASVGRFKVK